MFLRFLLPCCLIGLVIATGCIGETNQISKQQDQTDPVVTAAQQEGTTKDSPTTDSPTEDSPPEDSPTSRASTNLADQLKNEKEEFAKQSIEIPAAWKRLGKTSHIWADKDKKRVVVRGAICLREGLLEMFACPATTKEHESIVSVHALASEVHATFLAMGINPGSPMTWVGRYIPVSGPVMEVEVWWMEDGKLVKRRAQEMIKNCLLYTSPSPRDATLSRMPSSA